jgi:hypothetical protein
LHIQQDAEAVSGDLAQASQAARHGFDCSQGVALVQSYTSMHMHMTEAGEYATKWPAIGASGHFFVCFGQTWPKVLIT